MKRLVCAVVAVFFLLCACASEPTLDTAMKATEKFIQANPPSGEWSVGKNTEYDAVIISFTYAGYYVDASAHKLTQDDIDAWDGFAQQIVDINNEAKGAIDEAGYPASCICYVYDTTGPDGPILSVTDGEITKNYLADAEVVEWKKAYTFSSGNYTAGVDFGAGTYDITAISGSGNVYTSDLAINAMMGNEKGVQVGDINTADFYEKEYKNIYIGEGVVLSIDGVKIRIKLVE